MWMSTHTPTPTHTLKQTHTLYNHSTWKAYLSSMKRSPNVKIFHYANNESKKGNVPLPLGNTPYLSYLLMPLDLCVAFLAHIIANASTCNQFRGSYLQVNWPISDFSIILQRTVANTVRIRRTVICVLKSDLPLAFSSATHHTSAKWKRDSSQLLLSADSPCP